MNMRSVGFTREWTGNWSKVLNFLSPLFPYIKFEIPEIGFGLILNIPEEYDYNTVLESIKDEFDNKYYITNSEFESSRIILISI